MATDRTGEPELLAQIYAAPDDDTPRLVYADWLQERGDPRGELIALQIERARSKARKGGRQREDELIAEHGAAWAAALEPRMVLGADGSPDQPVVEFRRGFPTVVSADMINLHEAWSTVTHCNMPPHDDRCQVRALRAVTEATSADIIAMGKLTFPLAVEELVWGWRHDPKRSEHEPMMLVVPPEVIAAYASIQVLPALRRLEVSPKIVGPTARPSSLAWLWRSAVASSLEELLVPGHDLAAWIGALTPTRLRRFELAMAAETGYRWQVGTQIIVERDDARMFSRVTALVIRSTSSALFELSRIVAELDPGVPSTVRVAIASKAEWDKCSRQRAMLAQVFASHGIDGTIEKASR